MKRFALAIIFATLVLSAAAHGQRRGPAARTKPAVRSAENGQTAIVIDETLSVLRKAPSLFAESIHRMQRGRKVQILGSAEADGVKFFKVNAPPTSYGWVQADAVFGKFRAGDEERLARLVQALDGFDQIEAANQFFDLYPNSTLRPTILLLFGDALEEWAARHTKEANSQLKRLEMAASGAPMHSYFLNFVKLDRFRKVGVVFLFNPSTRAFHYDGASWKEIVEKFPKSSEAAEARKRLDSLKLKMEKTAAQK